MSTRLRGSYYSSRSHGCCPSGGACSWASGLPDSKQTQHSLLLLVVVVLLLVLVLLVLVATCCLLQPK